MPTDAADWGAVELTLPPGAAGGAWCLLRGRLLRRGGDYDARLYFDLGDGWRPECSMPIPTLGSGALHQFVLLPPRLRRAAFHPGRGEYCEIEALDLVRAGAWRRHLGMLLRVIPQLRLQSPARRRVLGLTWALASSDLAEAYRRASLLRAHAAAPSYQDWIAAHDVLGPRDRERITRDSAAWPQPPFFEVRIAGGDPEAVRRTRASLDDQLYPRHAWRAACGDEGTPVPGPEAKPLPGGRWLILLRAGDMLAPHALYWFAAVARSDPGCAMIFADEDRLDAAGRRCDPQFKPNWSIAHARARRFFGDAVALQAAAVARAGGVRKPDLDQGNDDLVFRVMESGARSHRIPAVLLHRGADARSVDPAFSQAAVEAHLRRQQVPAQVLPLPGGCRHVRHALPPAPPLVTVIIPTRDALHLVKRCVETLRRLTAYPALEILLVDNQSSEPEALGWMKEQAREGRVKLLAYDHAFNYSAINNMAVAQAAGELVCLLNNDTEIIHPDWLAEMVGHLLQPGVEVVGAKLLYANGLVQHGGDLVGVGGVANHAHAWLRADDPGYCARAAVAQDYSAVTGACLLTRKATYVALGGLNASSLPVAFSDVDYCLRVRAAGGRVVWTPHAQLVHHESVSRGSDVSRRRRRAARREARYMRRRWAEVLADDPFYNPNLNHQRADFSLGHAPVVHRPWRDDDE